MADRKVHQTPADTAGPLERGFSEITNATDFRGWVVGFYGEQSKALAGVANMIADAQTAKWQARQARWKTWSSSIRRGAEDAGRGRGGGGL